MGGKLARLARVVLPGVPHHVTQGGVRSIKIFSSDEDRFKAFRQGGGATSFTSLTFLFSKKLLHSIVGALWLDPLFAMRGLHFNGIDEEFIPIFVNLRFHQDAKYIRP